MTNEEHDKLGRHLRVLQDLVDNALLDDGDTEEVKAQLSTLQKQHDELVELVKDYLIGSGMDENNVHKYHERAQALAKAINWTPPVNERDLALKLYGSWGKAGCPKSDAECSLSQGAIEWTLSYLKQYPEALAVLKDA